MVNVNWLCKLFGHDYFWHKHDLKALKEKDVYIDIWKCSRCGATTKDRFEVFNIKDENFIKRMKNLDYGKE